MWGFVVAVPLSLANNFIAELLHAHASMILYCSDFARCGFRFCVSIDTVIFLLDI